MYFIGDACAVEYLVLKKANPTSVSSASIGENLSVIDESMISIGHFSPEIAKLFQNTGSC